MGLDMYLHGEKFLWTNNRIEDDFRIVEIKIELHGHIVRTFAGGVDECQRIALDKTQLEQLLLAASTEGALPHVEAFFFGASDSTAEEREADATIIRKAISWFETDDKGSICSVYYQASW